MLAMAEFEGWHPPNKSITPGGSRSYRNHNPGNLRSSPFESGRRGGFSFFRNDFVGWMAFHWDLMQKARGNTVTGLNRKSTIEQLIKVWAPASDGNDPRRYIDFVEKRSGLKRTTTLGQIFLGR